MFSRMRYRYNNKKSYRTKNKNRHASSEYCFIRKDIKKDNVLSDDISIFKSPIDVSDIVKHESFTCGFFTEEINNVSYSWKKINIDNQMIDFLLDKDGLVSISDTYLVRLRHGNGFSKGTIFIGSSYGFIATICIKNDGISGLYIPKSVHLKINVEVGDYIISRASRGIKFLPQIGGDAVYLVVSIVPSKKLANMGFIVPTVITTQSSEKATSIICNRRLKIISIVDKIIKIRETIEKNYVASYLVSEFLSIYDSYYKKSNSKHLKEEKRVTFSDDVDTHRKNALEYQIEKINNKIKDNDFIDNIKLSMVNDIKGKNKIMNELWEELTLLSQEINNLLDHNHEQYSKINSYIIKIINENECSKVKSEIIANLHALSNVGLYK
ncbi:hypothetical protein [White-tailed deer poxvirus]|nr:hypothetical protein [White-tailed deer poxvirus]